MQWCVCAHQLTLLLLLTLCTALCNTATTTTQQDVVVEPVAETQTQYLRGSWDRTSDRDTAGGPLRLIDEHTGVKSNPKWCQNPQYWLRLPEAASYDSCDVKLVLRRTADVSGNGVSLVGGGSGASTALSAPRASKPGKVPTGGATSAGGSSGNTGGCVFVYTYCIEVEFVGLCIWHACKLLLLLRELDSHRQAKVNNTAFSAMCL
eukprot:1288-Heterococcus_DN1.PRE.4